MLLSIEFDLRFHCRQTEGFANALFGKLTIKIPNFRTLHYRLSKMNIDLDCKPQHSRPDNFLIIIDTTALTPIGEEDEEQIWKGSKKGWMDKGSHS